MKATMADIAKKLEEDPDLKWELMGNLVEGSGSDYEKIAWAFIRAEVAELKEKEEK